MSSTKNVLCVALPLSAVMLSAVGMLFLVGCQTSSTHEKGEGDVQTETNGVRPLSRSGQEVNPRQIDRLTAQTPLDRFTPLQNEECCSDPGAIAECWWQDAQDDGVVCTKDADCTRDCDTSITVDGNDPPNGWGLCECEEDADCGDGVCTDGICGPSYCNGFQVCSCWGGCAPGNVGDYDNPAEMCGDTTAGQPGSCCEGIYPASMGGQDLGYCAADCGGGGGGGGSSCTVDADCVDPLPDPYSSDCIQYLCDQGICRLDYINAGGVCTDNPQSGGGDASCNDQICNAIGVCIYTALADGTACDDDSNPCTDDLCQTGSCIHDYSGNIGNDCNADDNACTLDECDTSGVCNVGPTKDCDDSNLCTGPDTCSDTDPNHIVPTCDNSPLADVNATAYGYTDTVDCQDLVCDSGVEVLVNIDCDHLDDSCNDYSCVEGNGEDNCTASYLSFVGDGCDDGDDCTVGDRCVDATDHGECQPTGSMDCDDGESCTTDTCSAGVCSNTPDTGASCSDGNPCTLSDTCDDTGACVPGSAKDCSSVSNQCTNGVCNTSNGMCEASYLAGGTTCDADSNPCTVGDQCNGSGTCVAGGLKDCSSETDQCNTGVCNTGTGVCEGNPTPHEGNACDADSSLCTPNDTCQSGTCVADTSPVDCSGDNDQCNISTCNAATGSCEYSNATIVDDPCNLDNDGCTNETCQGDAVGDQELTCTALSTNTCSDGNECTADNCISDDFETWHCYYPNLPDTTSCNLDSDGCTRDDRCDGYGSCEAGTTITAAMCEAEKVAADSAFDLDCNTAACVSLGDNTYRCDAVANTTSPGDCNADYDGCTLDTCDGFDTSDGATCVVGSARDCTGIDNQCQTGVCDDGGSDYNSSCTPSYETSGTSCNNDGNGCTVNDACNGTGSCIAGADATCTPSGPCISSTCESTGDNTYTCNETADASCCTVDADCLGKGYPCESGDVCNALVCNSGICECEAINIGGDCSAQLEEATYPSNCYTGVCNDTGVCAGTLKDVSELENNLCSDIFDPADPTQFDSTIDAFLGELDQSDATGTYLAATGSTLCADDNYRAKADNNCIETATGDPLGETGNDLVYGFRYQNPPAGSMERYAYVVKVESDFDANVFAKNNIFSAAYCPEGDNPDEDTSDCSGKVFREIWWNVLPGYRVTDIPIDTPADETGTLSNLETPEDYGNYYGERIRGYITAPTTGDYTFWTCSDNDSQVWLSTDTNPANAQMIASIQNISGICPGWAVPDDWNKCSIQKSDPISLVAGEMYYIEVLHSDNWMGDNLQVGWAKPGEDTTEPSEIVPSSVLTQWDGDPSGTSQSAPSVGTSGVRRLGTWKANQNTNLLPFGAPFMGEDRVMLVAVQTEDSAGAITINNVTYGGNTGTRVYTQSTGSTTETVAELWLFDENDLLTQSGGNIEVDMTAEPDGMSIHAGIYENVDQTTPIPYIVGDEHASTSPNPMTGNDLDAAAGSAVISFATNGNSRTVIWGSDLTEKTEQLADSSAGSIGETFVTSDGVVSCRATWSSPSRLTQWSAELVPPGSSGGSGSAAGGGGGGGGGGSSVARLGSWVTNTDSTTLNYGAPPAGDDRLLVVGIQVEITTGSLSVDNVTYGGVPGTQVSSLLAGTTAYKNIADVWIFDESEIAAQSGGMISATITGTVSSMTMHAGMYENVDQTTPLTGAAVESVNHGATPVTADNGAAAGSAVVAFASTGNKTSATWGTGVTEQTDRQSPLNYSTTGSAADALVSADGTVNCRPTWASQNRATITSIELTPVFVPVATDTAVATDTGVATDTDTDTDTGSATGPTGDCTKKLGGWACSLPYSDSPARPVIEERCDDSGNSAAGQECCDPCTGVDCYKWCERGYNTDGTSCNLCAGGALGNCDAKWTYPDDPYNCDANIPVDGSYSTYTEMATTVIYPTANDGAWANAVIYVDGSNGEAGNFYVTVEKRIINPNPCERANDDGRIIDVTNVGTSGQTFDSTVEGLVNSNHAASGSCGGYDCTAGFGGETDCHDVGSSPNDFWPAEAYFHIYRTTEEGSGTYCLTTTDPGGNPLDAVISVEMADGSGGVCADDYTYSTCAYNNYNSATDARVELTALANKRYRIGVSRQEDLGRPCLNSSGDNCDFNLHVIEGGCPSDCVTPGTWYEDPGYINAVVTTVDGETFSSTYTDSRRGELFVELLEGDTTAAARYNTYDPGTGWNADDELWRLEYTGDQPKMVYFSGCDYGGYGSFDGRMALFDCQGTLLITNDDGCDVDDMASFSYEMRPFEGPYYLLVDGDSTSDSGAYGIAVYLEPTCSDSLANGYETDVDCGGVQCSPCETGESCDENSDCLSGSCSSGTCS